ncbi:PAAR domain-containing protein [Actinobacillus vicugnae]|uniref:PAAR domain-containing protein n=1 Tax=Actinobacillus vicugnae TaxID=2573093 RepID=UPI001241812B|nr:PAAR domain-containing protein [Actinobacillus vicugnae]
MASRRAIIVGDKTTHGGIVIQGSHGMSISGNNISLEGDLVTCPKCNGNFPIIEGSSKMTSNGKGVALEGMRISCGAILIGSQNLVWVDGDEHYSIDSLFAEDIILNKEKNYKIQFHFIDDDGNPYANTAFSVLLPEGLKKGMTNENGMTPIFYTEDESKVKIHLHINEKEAFDWE